MIKCIRLLLCVFLLHTAQESNAQTIRDSSIVRIKEREYKLIELPNGDLLPFVNQGSGNSDKYLENGRLMREVFLGLFGEETGYSIYKYVGDTLQTIKRYSKDHVLKESDSVIFANKKVKEGFHTEYYRNRTESDHTISIDTGNVIQKTVYYENDKIIRTRMMARLDTVNLYLYNLDGEGKRYDEDTLYIYHYPDSLSRLVTFHRKEHKSYTINEYEKDHRGSIISCMTFYNQDSVGDHITSFVRRIEYKNEKPPVINRKFFIGYWVMMDGMRYWQFLENGKMWMRRAGRDKETIRNWGWDENRRQVYIELTAEDKEDLHEADITGNRLYLRYEPDEQLLVYDDNKYQKRPVLKRKPRDEKKVKAMLSAATQAD